MMNKMKNILGRWCVAALSAMSLLLIAPTTQAQVLSFKTVKLDTWSFSKDLSHGWTAVTVPHSYNAIDGHSASYYRGLGYYKKTLTLKADQVARPLFLLFEGAAQAAEVSVNGKSAAVHRGGYTAFVVPLKGLMHAGDNEILVTCDNREDVNLIPVSSDFNKNGGLHNPAFFLQMNDVYLSPFGCGLYRLHVATPSVTAAEASTEVSSTIINASQAKKLLKMTLTLTDSKGKVVYRSSFNKNIAAGDSLAYRQTFALKNPHLWNGLADPYLYKVRLEVADGAGKVLDRASTEVGYRFYRMDAEKGFFLNGHPYPLRGVAMHQDADKKASALTEADFDRDYRIVAELGANFLRLAHYPHNDYAFRLCDKLGIIVQTEIPWVNVCGVHASKSYIDDIHQQMREMITNLYNHPSILFWGLWNELDVWGNNDKLQGPIDIPRIVSVSASLYRLSKSLDPSRLVGMSDCNLYKREGYDKLKADYYSENRYNGWYYNKFSDFKKEYDDIHHRMGITNVSEYGAGNNPFCQSYDTLLINNKDNSRHYEEWANKFHEAHIRQMMEMPYLNFTAVWIMYDFPVASRKEGFMDSSDGIHFTENKERLFMNDKGLVTRDRLVKKDVFYLYKSWWNKKVTTVYIAGRRRSKPAAGTPISLKVYSNAHRLTLYQNGVKKQTLDNSGEATGIIWRFSPLTASSSSDTFRVAASDGTQDTW